MPWEKSYSEQDVLTRAMEAFWARGYEATSMSDLVTATGINRGSMYAAFTDKRTLFIRALDHYDRHYRVEFLRQAEKGRSPADAIIAAFEQAIGTPNESKDRRGCLLVNTALELSPHDSEIDQIVRKSFTAVETFFRDMIKRGQAQGSISATIDSADKARALLGLFLGLRVLMKSSPDPQMSNAILSQAKAMVA